MRSGTSRAGARAASSHTAALAGSDAAVEALFWQAGVLRARTLEELLDAAVFFSSQPLPRGNRVAVLTNAGGLGILCADACEAAGLSLPALTPETVAALERVAARRGEQREPRRSARLGDRGDIRGRAADRSCRSRDRRGDRALRAAGGRDDRRRVGSDRARLRRGREAGPARRDQRRRTPAGSFTYPESAARALGLAARRADWLRRPASGSTALDGVDRGEGRGDPPAGLAGTDDLWLEPEDVARCSRRTACPSSRALCARRRAGAGRRRRLGYPVVVKTAAAGAHKTESGGVHVDLRDEAAVDARPPQSGRR